MLLLRVLLSALTLFGGHVLNRRLDRVLLVFALLAILGGICFAAPTLLFNASRFDLMSTAFNAVPLVLIAIALISAALTWKDAKAPPLPPLTLTSRIAGGTVSVFGLIITAFATMMLLASAGGKHSSGKSVRSSPPAQFRHMYASAYLGGNIHYEELQPPPAGPHPLRGRIVMAGRPVVDATVEVVLNESFRAESLTTDAQGEFELRLPAGPWAMNQVVVTRWPDGPEGVDLLLYSEHEPLKDAGYYYSGIRSEVSALRVVLPAPTDFKQPTFELREPVTMQWPAASTGRPSEPSEAPKADPATSVIGWEEVPGATEYEIQLHSVKREHRTMSTNTLLLRRQSDTQLRLADLPKQQETAAAKEYSISVYAFDANGKVLSQTRDGFASFGFVLDGETQLAKEPVQRSSANDSVEQLRNVERLSLVSGLLEYRQLDAARAILKEVTNQAPPGRKAAMQGAIEALSGNCAAAIPLLDQADKEGGLGCAPLKYRQMCPSR